MTTVSNTLRDENDDERTEDELVDANLLHGVGGGSLLVGLQT